MKVFGSHRCFYSSISDVYKVGANAEFNGVNGWIRSFRKQKNVCFLKIFDGSSHRDLQVVTSPELVEHVDLSVGASVKVSGLLQKSPGKGQDFELQATSLSLVGKCPPDYPLQKKEHSDEFLRDIAQLRARTSSFAATLRVRNTAAHSLHSHLQCEGFIEVNGPIIVSGDCEGAGEMFNVSDKEKSPFFGTDANLTVSAQLHGEALACAMSKVYVFGPTFRAERHSKTSVHLAEFWMLEPEFVCEDLSQLLDCAESMVKSATVAVASKHAQDIALIGKKSEQELTTLSQGKEFVRMSYTEAIEVLQKSGVPFSFPVSWGVDLQREHERYLCEKYSNNTPVFVTDYPKAIKPFYAKKSVERHDCVQAVDLLVPGIGELIGGSVREDDFDVLTGNMRERNMDVEQYEWYLSLRKYGSVPHAGFGLGFERFVQYLTGITNIRDTLPFPRWSGSIKF